MYTGIAELILMWKYLYILLNLYWYFVSYTCTTKYILVLQNLYLCCGAYSCLSDTEVPVGTIEHFDGTKVPVGTTEQIH